MKMRNQTNMYTTNWLANNDDGERFWIWMRSPLTNQTQKFKAFKICTGISFYLFGSLLCVMCLNPEIQVG